VIWATGLAASRDEHAVAGSGAPDQLAKVRPGIDKIYISHRELSDHLGGRL